jgi:hypothetical protein
MSAKGRRSLEPSADGWTYAQEREFLENLVYQRVNYFLVLFGLVVAGASAATSLVLFKCVLWFGTVILSLLGVAIAGVQWKLDFVLDVLFEHPEHPITVVSAAARHGRLRGLVGYVIPVVCCAAILLAAILATIGILTVGSP